MDNYKKISKFVNEQLKVREISSKQSITDFINSCYDEYLFLIDEGYNENEALLKAKKTFCDSLDNTYKNPSSKNKFDFSFIITVVFTIVSLVMTTLGLFILDITDVYGVIYPIILVLSSILFIYVLVTRKKRCLLDYIMISIIFLSVLIVNVQVIMYFYRARTFDYYYTANYDFPGIISFNRHWISAVDPNIYEINKVVYLFDPCLLVSIFSLFFMTIFKIKRKEKSNV